MKLPSREQLGALARGAAKAASHVAVIAAFGIAYYDHHVRKLERCTLPLGCPRCRGPLGLGWF
jgi:hypothetical protein